MVLKNIIASLGEKQTQKLLQEYFNQDERIFPKIRLADAFDIGSEIWTEDERDYMLKSHFDFLITDLESKPLLAIEYDGEYHSNIKQKKRDELKNEICEKGGLWLVRLNKEDFKEKNGILPAEDKIASTPLGLEKQGGEIIEVYIDYLKWGKNALNEEEDLLHDTVPMPPMSLVKSVINKHYFDLSKILAELEIWAIIQDIKERCKKAGMTDQEAWDYLINKLEQK